MGNHSIYEVASPEGWRANRELVLKFYNQRRTQLAEVEPNQGHRILQRLEADFEVQIITQNVDNLHERAGSTKVLHLHGELTKARSTTDKNLVYDIGTKPILLGDKCEKGSQLRPHIVWFGEDVPLIEVAAKMVEDADVLVVVGTSMQVYPAAGLIDYVPRTSPIYVIDPEPPTLAKRPNVHFIQAGGSEGLARLQELIR